MRNLEVSEINSKAVRQFQLEQPKENSHLASVWALPQDGKFGVSIGSMKWLSQTGRSVELNLPSDVAAAHDCRMLELEKQVEMLQAKLVKADLLLDVQNTFHSAGAQYSRHAERAKVISAANTLADQVGVAAA